MRSKNTIILTAKQFDLIVDQMNLSDQNINIARAVFVEGKDQAELARQNNVSTQNINALIRRIKDRYLQIIPNDWVQINTYIPKSLAKAVEKHVTDELKELTKK